MGLSEEEVAERFRTVTSKVQKVTESMVTCDTKYRDKLERRCKEQQAQVDALRQELEAGGIKVEAMVATMTSLGTQNRDLRDKLHELEMVKEKQMLQIRLRFCFHFVQCSFQFFFILIENFYHKVIVNCQKIPRALLAKEVSLAKTLGVKSLEVNSRRLPDTNTVKRLEKQVEDLTRLSEEREQKMFTIKEEVIHLLDVLDLDLNATSIEEMLIVNQDQFDALQSKDVESAQQTLNNLREKVEVKKNEVCSLPFTLSYLMHL